MLKTWEYRVEDVDAAHSEDLLNEWGQQGWELTNAETYSSLSSFFESAHRIIRCRYFLKRQK